MIHLRILPSLLFLCTIITTPPSAHAAQELRVWVDECTGDTDVFVIDYLTITCEDYCTWGSNGTYDGSYTLGEDVSTETPVVTNKIWGLRRFNDTVDICEDGSVYNDDGDRCPEAGTYGYETEAILPGSPNSWYAWIASWMTVTVHSTIDFGDAVVVCKIKIKGMKYAEEEDSSSYSSTYMIAGSSMVFLGFAAAFNWKKRRIVVAGDGNGREQLVDEPATRFVEMPKMLV
jgi:hypothetical protein